MFIGLVKPKGDGLYEAVKSLPRAESLNMQKFKSIEEA
jgi:hypothetical protein